MKWVRLVIICGVLLGGCVATEIVMRRRVDPASHATTLEEYLAWRPSGDSFAAIDVKDEVYVIAYGPRSSLVPSGPSAYVFDDAGQLVDWSYDIGDDPEFDDQWDAQASRTRGRTLEREEVVRWGSE